MAVYDFSGAFRNLNSSIAGLGQTFEEQRRRDAIAGIGTKLSAGDYNGAAQGLMAAGDVTNGLKALEFGHTRSLQADAMRQAGQSLDLNNLGAGSGGAPVANGSPLANLGTPGQVETRFMGAVREAGLNNPFGLAALAATGHRESRFSPQNANRTWSDPSQSGQPGTSGGILSWRGPRLQNMFKFAQSRGEQPGNISPETQALFAFQEDPTLIHRLNAAKSDAEATDVMARAWRFAGYDNRNSAEYQARLGATRQYMARYNQGGGGGQQIQVAQAGPSEAQRAQMAIARVDSLLNDPQLSPEQRQSLQQRREQYAQVAQADVPAQGAQPAQGFSVPGQQQGEVDIPPARARAAIAELTRRMAHPGNTEGMRASYKTQIDQLTPYADPMRMLDRRSKELGIQEAERKAARGDTTGDITEYEYARQQGYTGSFSDFQMNKSQKTTINNNMPDGKGETKFAETLGAKQAERWNNYITEGDVAQTRMADIGQLREASRRLGSQGSSANLKMLIGPYAESLNIKIDGLPDIQLYESITNRLAPQLRAIGSGSTSDIEFKGFLRAIGPLSNSPAAREMILDTFEAASRNDLSRAEIATRLATGEITRGQAERDLRALPSPMEAYRAFRKANSDVVGEAIKSTAKQESEERKKVQVKPGTVIRLHERMTPDQIRKRFPSGTKVILPDGSEGMVP